MRILFLTTDVDETDGWGRYSAGYLAQARKRLGREDVDDFHFRIDRTIPGPLRFLRVAILARRLRQRASASDLIHALTEPAAPLAGGLSRLTGRPFLVSVHGTYADAAAYPWWVRGTMVRAFRSAAAIVAVSRYTAEVVRRSSGARRVEVIPGGFDPPEASAPRSPSGNRRLLAVGAVKPRKGYHTLLRALGVLKRDGFDAGLAVVGSYASSSEYYRSLQELIRTEGLGDRVEFLGRVPEEELRRRYAEADLFVLPSEHVGAAFEGLGLVYLEALSRGLPVVGCRDSGAEDVIRHGENGFLVPPGDVETLAEAVRQALDDEGLWRRMSAAAPGSVRGFAWDEVGKKMMDLWEDLKRRSDRS
jgi:glycosyltransferase involved in cell wall biosynthesis